jgi:hypothetical protein
MKGSTTSDTARRKAEEDVADQALAQTPTPLGALPAPPRKKTGGAAHLSPAERRDIQQVHLEEGLNQTQLAHRFDRTREAIANCLKGEDFDALKAHVQQGLAEIARAKLASGVEKAADAWVRSVDTAADKGDHKPAKDLLMHTGVIEREASGRGDTFQVFIGMPGEPIGPAPVIDLETVPEATMVSASPTTLSVPSVEVLQREIERLQRQLAERHA